MSKPCPSSAAPILAALAILGALLGMYVAGYFGLGSRIEASRGLIVRVYDTEWHVAVFSPAAKMESLLTGTQIWVIAPP